MKILRLFRIDNIDEILKLFWPIALSMILTNTLAFVDTFMIASYDILGVSGISAATQIQFIFGPMYFAILMGIGIYTVQYFSGDKLDDLKKLSGIGLILLLGLDLINFIILILFSDSIINFMAPGDANSIYVINLATDYMIYYKYSLLLAPITMFFTYQYRAIKKPKIALYLGILQSLLNIVFNILFIYGLFIFPEMGVKGAGLATLLSRAFIVVFYVIYSSYIKAPFLGVPREMFSFKYSLFKDVVKNTIPLILVELGFGLGNLVYLKIYSLTGTDGYTAYNIAKSISFMINAFVISTANVLGILAGTAIIKEKLVLDVRNKMSDVFKFMIINSLVLFLVSIFILPLFIPIFTTNEYYMSIIRSLLVINGFWMALRVFSSSFIAILKSGNDNRFVLFLDAGLTYIVGIPVTLTVYFLFHPGIVVLRSIIIIEFIFKVIIGFYRYNQNKWIKKV